MAFASITITQAFLGAPLQFQPPLASREFGELLDAFVTGSASKQEKLSEMTIDFYNNATVDLNTGALVKTYFVFSPASSAAVSPWTFTQSPVQSQSSGLSPSIYTPSPSSSAANLADSGYGSFSALTPPVRSRNNGAASAAGSGRVAKKVKKDTKKVAEMRLPGFSIMTKDGIDVTNSAGRGTKSKEQREHAHLMRIMKACGDCKKKKIKCDPSHRRSVDDTTRDSGSTPNTSRGNSSSNAWVEKSSYTASPADPTPPPPPSSSWEYADTSFYDFPASGDAMGDFVLFPDGSASWNAESSPHDDYDLGNFNFDISDVGGVNDTSLLNPNPSFSLDEEPQGFSPTHQTNRAGRAPLSTYDQYDLTRWTEHQDWLPVSQSQPISANSSQDSLQSASSGWNSDSHIIHTLDDAFNSDGTFARGGLLDRSSPGNGSPLQQSPTSPFSADWSSLEGSINANITPPQNSSGLPGILSRHRLRDAQVSNWVDMSDSGDSIEQALAYPAGSMSSSGLQHSEGSLSYLGHRRGSRSKLYQSPLHSPSRPSGLSDECLESSFIGYNQSLEGGDEVTSRQLGVLQTHARVRPLTVSGDVHGATVESVAATQTSSVDMPSSGLTTQLNENPGETVRRVFFGRSSTYQGLAQSRLDHVGSVTQAQRPQGIVDRSGQQLISSTMSRAKIHTGVEPLQNVVYQTTSSRNTRSTMPEATSQTNIIGASPRGSVAQTNFYGGESRQQPIGVLIASSSVYKTKTKAIGGHTTEQSALTKSEPQQPSQFLRSTLPTLTLPLVSCLLAICLGGIMVLLGISNQQPTSLMRQPQYSYESRPSSGSLLSLIEISQLTFVAMLVACTPTITKMLTGHWADVSKMLSGHFNEPREDTCKGLSSLSTASAFMNGWSSRLLRLGTGSRLL